VFIRTSGGQHAGREREMGETVSSDDDDDDDDEAVVDDPAVTHR
jgi:hypothetical protein